MRERMHTIFHMLHYFDSEKTKDEMMKEGGLNYTVQKRPLYFFGDAPDWPHNHQPEVGWNASTQRWELDPKYLPKKYTSPYHVEMVRVEEDGEIIPLGVVGVGYGDVQNEEVADLCEIWNQDGRARYIAAGAPNNGERIYIAMRAPEFIKLGPDKDDRIDNCFFVTSAHDGSEQIVAYPAPVHLKSGSILTAANRSAGAIKIKHTKHVGRRISDAKKVMKHLSRFWESFERTATMFAEVKIDDRTVNDYVTCVLAKDGEIPADNDLGTRKNNIRDEMIDLYHHGPSSKMPYARGTLLGAYLAVTTYADHVKTVRTSKKRNENAARVHAILIGDGARLKAEALGFALQLQKKLGGVK